MELGPIITTPLEETAHAASVMGHLVQLSKQVTKCTLSRRLLERLKEEKVGTYRVEIQALNFNQDPVYKRECRGKKRMRIHLVLEQK